MPLVRRSLVTLAALALLVPVVRGQVYEKVIPNPRETARHVNAMLDQFGPQSTGSDWVARKQIADFLDQMFVVPLDPAEHPLLNPSLRVFISEFFRLRMRTALSKIANDPAPAQGINLYKLYSSTFVMKAAEGTVCIDFAEGPFPYLGVPGFSPTDIANLADHLDVYCISHIHPDHFSIALMAEMVARNKIVIATQEIVNFLLGNGYLWGSALVVPQTLWGQLFLGNLGIFTFPGHQYFAFLDGDLRRPDPSHFAPVNNCYVIRLGGKFVAHFGDNNDFLVRDWCVRLLQLGVQVDFILQANAMRNQLIGLLQPTYTYLGHEWEFTHFAAGFLLLNIGTAPNPNKRILIWGESEYLP